MKLFGIWDLEFWISADNCQRFAFSAFVLSCSRILLSATDEPHRTHNVVDGLCAGCSVSVAGMETLRAGCLPETDRGDTVGGGFHFYGTGLLCGGTVHGFTLILSSSILAGLWKVTVYLTGFSSFFLLSAVLMAGLTPPVRRWALALSALKLVVYLAWMVTHDDFLFVVYDYGSAMILILIFQVWAFYKHQSSAAGWIVGGILLSFVGAAIQQSGLSLYQHFNHNDLFHIVQMGAFYLLYRGGNALCA